MRRSAWRAVRDPLRRLGRGAAFVALALALAAGTGGNTPVADAAMQGNADTLRSLVENGADVNAAQGDGMTALHWAARRADGEMVSILLAAGADVDATTRIGAHTPLHLASRAGTPAIVEQLLEAGADPLAVTEAGVVALHLAAIAGDRRSVEALLAHGARADVTEPSWGQTPLMMAAARGRVDAARALLEAGADPSVAGRVVDLGVRSAVDREARQRRNEMLARFREQEGDPQAWRPTSHQVQEAVRAAREVERLAQIAAEDAGEEDEPWDAGADGAVSGFTGLVGTHGGLTALLLACRDGHVEVVDALLQGGADIDQPNPGDGTTPILMAAINGHFDLVVHLLERGADPNLASHAGATPLYGVLNKEWAPASRHPQPTFHQQQEHSYLEVMELLLESGADPNVRLNQTLWYTTYNRDNLSVDRTGATPFWRAAYAVDVQAMRLLLAYGADPHVPTAAPAPRRGGGGYGGDDAPEEDPSGLPPVEEGGPGVWPIHAASGVGYGQGYAANDHRHVRRGWIPAVKLLVEELGADVNARDHDGYNAVHHAAARGDNELVLYLVEQGADVTAVSRRGQTTADMANGPVQRISPFLETVALLEELGSANSNNCVSC